MLKLSQGQTVASTTTRSRRVLVYFTAPWCTPCQALKPHLTTLAGEHADLSVVLVDVDEHADEADAHAVEIIPLLKLYRDGAEVASHAGTLTLPQARTFVAR